jgi:hypothetical protein
MAQIGPNSGKCDPIDITVLYCIDVLLTAVHASAHVQLVAQPEPPVWAARWTGSTWFTPGHPGPPGPVVDTQLQVGRYDRVGNLAGVCICFAGACVSEQQAAGRWRLLGRSVHTLWNSWMRKGRAMHWRYFMPVSPHICIWDGSVWHFCGRLVGW